MSLKAAAGTLFPLLLLLSACKQNADLGEPEPPEIMYGQDVCDECGMIINERRFAASYVTVTGEVRRFDDIGGMLVHDHEVNEEVQIYWVHDLNTEEWIDAGEAVFVVSGELATPMGWGVAAFTHTTDAETYAADHGGVIATFVELKNQINTGSLVPEGLMDAQP